MPARGRRAQTTLVVALIGLLTLTGCARSSDASSPGNAAPSATVSTPPAPAATLSVTPANGTTKVRPEQVVSVKAAGGRLGTVTVATAAGTPIAGTVGNDGVWRSTVALPLSASVKVNATATNADGAPSTLTSSFSTLKPVDTERASISPRDKSVVGVAMPIIVTFDHKVTNKAAVEKALKVDSLPMTTGAWHWMSAREVQYRPMDFWQAGSRVTVSANLSGVELAKGIWGEDRKPVSFTVGARQVVTVSLDQHTLTLERDGAAVRTIPVTNGKDGHAKWETRTGTKVIMTQETSRKMDAATTGVPVGSPDYYSLQVKYAMRLTNSGEFIHAAPWSEWAQGKENVSHGCTGASVADARWLMENTRVGDPVIVTGGSRTMEKGNGWTLWDMSWPEWQAGSALA